MSALAPPLFLLGGCVVQPVPGISAWDARTELVDVLDATQRLVGGTWQNQDDPIARACRLPVWSDGEQFGALRTADGPRDPESAAGDVTRLWEGRGYEVDAITVGTVIQLSSGSLVFRVNDRAMTLQGESECRPA